MIGPAIAGGRGEDAEALVVAVDWRPPVGPPTPLCHERANLVRRFVESLVWLRHHPRCLITVAIQIGREDGGTLAAALNATVAALLDAGVPLRGLAAAAAVAAAPGSPARFVVDPNGADEAEARACATAAAPLPALGWGEDAAAWGRLPGGVAAPLLVAHAEGPLSLAETAEALALAAAASARAGAVIRGG